MIYGIGTDIIEVGRIKKQLTDTGNFKSRIFTKSEINFCDSKANYAERYAARFAAKEAFFKALGTGCIDGMAFNEIEVIRSNLGKPEILLHGKTKENLQKQGNFVIHLSLTHIKEMVNAVVIIEKI